MSVIPLRAQLRASILASVDTIDLFSAMAEAGNDIRSAAQSVYSAHKLGSPPTEPVLVTAECAARRVLRIVSEYRLACDETR